MGTSMVVVVSWENVSGEADGLFEGMGDEWSLAITTTLILLGLAGVTAIDSSCQTQNLVIPTLVVRDSAIASVHMEPDNYGLFGDSVR